MYISLFSAVGALLRKSLFFIDLEPLFNVWVVLQEWYYAYPIPDVLQLWSVPRRSELSTKELQDYRTVFVDYWCGMASYLSLRGYTLYGYYAALGGWQPDYIAYVEPSQPGDVWPAGRFGTRASASFPGVSYLIIDRPPSDR